MSYPSIKPTLADVSTFIKVVESNHALSGNAALILIYAFNEAYLVSGANGTFRFGIHQWIKRTGMHDCTIRKHREELSRLGYLTMVEPHQGNAGPIYKVNLSKIVIMSQHKDDIQHT